MDHDHRPTTSLSRRDPDTHMRMRRCTIFFALVAHAHGLALSDATSTLNAFRAFLGNPETGHLCEKPPRVKIASVPGKGNGLVATREVEAGDALLALPADLRICPSGFLASIAKTGAAGAALAEAGGALAQSPEGDGGTVQ